MQVSIQDDAGRELASGETGEICVCGPAVFAGYYDNPEANAKAFRDGWFRTGDLGHMDAEGFLYITGRASDMYISGGSNVYPREIEEKMLTHPAVAEVAILGVPDRTWGEVGVAVCVLRPGATMDEAALLPWMDGKVVPLQASQARVLLGCAAEIRLRQDHQACRSRGTRSTRLSAAAKGCRRRTITNSRERTLLHVGSTDDFRDRRRFRHRACRCRGRVEGGLARRRRGPGLCKASSGVARSFRLAPVACDTEILDVSDEDAITRCVAACADEFGPIAGAVNSAGIASDIPAMETSAALFRKILEVNLIGSFLVSREIARHMQVHGGGSIVNISSVSGIRGNSGRVAYGASKSGVINMTKVLAVEWAPMSIRVNAIAPGPIETPLVRQMHTAESRAEWLHGVPLDRYGEPSEIAGTAIYLLDSAKSSYVTGQTISVDGGYTAAGLQHNRRHS